MLPQPLSSKLLAGPCEDTWEFVFNDVMPIYKIIWDLSICFAALALCAT